MRKKRRNKNDIIIDLTALLDVVFIVLLVLVCQLKDIRSEVEETRAMAEETMQEASALKQEAESSKYLYENQIETANSLNNYIISISVSVLYQEDNPEIREIRILKENEEFENPIKLEGNTDIKDRYDEFEEIITRFADENPEQPILMSLVDNEERTLYRDENLMLESFDNLSDDNSNIYIKHESETEKETE